MQTKRRVVKILSETWPALGLILLLTFIVMVTWAIGDRVLARTVTEMLINVVLVVGIYIFVGNSGILSFGHIGFAAIAAYAAAWQTCCPVSKGMYMPGLPEFMQQTTVPVVPAGVLGGVLAAVVALVVGIALMRLSGLAASIGTFCFLAIVYGTYANWESLTLGTGSIVGIPIYVTPLVALSWSVLAIVVAYVYQRSRHGLALQASREDDVAATECGVDVVRERLIAFVISAFFAGIGGVLHAHFVGVLSVNVFYLAMTFITLSMLVIGGMRSLAGAVVGVLLLSTIIEVLRWLERGHEIGGAVVAVPRGTQEIVLGLLMLVTLIFRPNGLMGNSELKWPWGNAIGVAREARKAKLKFKSKSVEMADVDRLQSRMEMIRGAQMRTKVD